MKVIRFSAIWCSGCLVMRPRWKEVFEKYNDLEIVDYDYDMDEEEVQKYQIGNIIPVLIFMDNDKEIKRVIGEVSKQKLEEVVGELL